MPADFLRLGPELALVAAAALILAVDLASSRRRVGLYTAIAVLGVGASVLLAFSGRHEGWQRLLGGAAAFDAFALFFKPVFAGAALLATLFSLR